MDTIEVGARVELDPCCDDWMRGDRYGTVVRVNRDINDHIASCLVRLDKSGDEHTYAVELLTELPNKTIVDRIVDEECEFLRNRDLDLVWNDGCLTLKCDDLELDEWFMGRL